MAEYRVYKLDRGGHVSDPPKIILHNTDEEAIAHTQQLYDGTECELWQGARMILHLPIGAVKSPNVGSSGVPPDRHP